MALVGCAVSTGPTVDTVTPTAVAPESSSIVAPSATPSTTVEEAGACLTAARAMPLQQQVGQLYMMAVQAGTPVETAVEQVRASDPGAVILLGDWPQELSRIRSYTDALRAASSRGLLIAVDQEGGLVQRLQGPGFDVIPAASVQTTMPAADLQEAWSGWGTQLSRAGIDWDLAPVADVVPESNRAANEPVAQLGRGFGADPGHVASQVQAVVSGLDAAGIATSVKHFPGLGRVRANTDLAVAHDQVSTLSADELVTFQAALDAGASSVMVSSAVYDRVDPDHPAVFSPAIITGVLRQTMGFDGLVVSDDLGVAAAVAEYPVAERGTRFLAAGGDMVIVADVVATAQMAEGTVQVATGDAEFAESLAVKVARVLELKQARGLVTCG